MSKIVRELIEYNGIDDIRQEFDIFNQENYDFIFSLVEQRVECETIEKVWIEYMDIQTKSIDTHRGTSLEQQNLTGKALIIVGDFNIKIQYTSSNMNRSIHTIEKKIPFSSMLVLPEDFKGNEYVEPIIIIEDISTKKVNSKTIYNNISVVFSVTIY